MPFLASDVMDQSAAYLNDTALSLFTYTAQLPYVKMANEKLEKLLLMYGTSIQRMVSATITVAAHAKTLTLPTDFLLPEKLFERAPGDTDDAWVPMYEKDYEPNSTEQTTLMYWAFRNNAINFVGCSAIREVRMQYERQLAIITSQNSPEDFYLSKNYLSAKTAELCARYIGMNKERGDELRDNEVFMAEDDLMRILVLNNQANGSRRQRFTTGRYNAR